MDLASIIGFIAGISLVFNAIYIGGDLHNFVNLPGMMIVGGGTVAATLLTFQFKDVIASFSGAFKVFSSDKVDHSKMIQTMIKICNISRSKGLIALQDIKTPSPFLGRACDLIADATDEKVLRSILRTEIESMKARHFVVQDIFKKMAMYAPALGMMGTLIGLVQMLTLLEDPSAIGPAMAVALLTTFYGSFLSSLVFLPISGKLRARTLAEVMSLEIIFEGAIAILDDNNPMTVHERLSSYLAAAKRKPMKKRDPVKK